MGRHKGCKGTGTKPNIERRAWSSGIGLAPKLEHVVEPKEGEKPILQVSIAQGVVDRRTTCQG